jgi:plasmid stabilization system protein ParE
VTYLVRIRPEAERDVEAACAWYEQQQAGLGVRLVADLDATYERLQQSPLIYAQIYRGVRRALLRHFPVGVFYLVERAEVRVLAVVHLARDPLVWQSRDV